MLQFSQPELTENAEKGKGSVGSAGADKKPRQNLNRTRMNADEHGLKTVGGQLR
jgi:hypothetical protein